MNTAIVEKKIRGIWENSQVTSPQLNQPVQVITAKDIPYVKDSNRLQNLNVYLPRTNQNQSLTGTHDLPERAPGSRWLIYIHGGAWRDPLVLSDSFEPTVAHVFGSPQESITAVASINYSLSPYPTHPTDPYDPSKGDQNDNAREFQHPRHVMDVIAALDFLHDVFGLNDNQYILAGHSCGATLALQATLVEASFWSRKERFTQPPRPAAIFGLHGLYDLPLLVHEPSTHEDLRDEYGAFLKLAFGDDETSWKTASPAHFAAEALIKRAKDSAVPALIVLDQSKEDQLVPSNQTESMLRFLKQVPQIRAAQTEKLTGPHNEPWETGATFWNILQDIVNMIE